MSTPVELERSGAVVVLRLSRASARNAIDPSAMTAFERALDALDAEDAPETRALILTASGDEAFCAGGDLKHFATLATREAGLAMSRRMQALLARLEDGPRYVIAAINGNAYGGGCELLTACHYRIAAEHARFAFRQAANGVTTGWGGGRRLLRMLCPSTALELLVTSRELDADEAWRLGLVDRVVPKARLLPAAMELAQTIVANPWPPVRAFLELARHARARDASLAELETERFGDTWTSPEFAATLRRFLGEQAFAALRGAPPA